MRDSGVVPLEGRTGQGGHLDAERYAPKCILVVGFRENDEWQLQREWFRADLKVPLRFVSDWREQIANRLMDPYGKWMPDLILFESKELDERSFDLLKWLRAQPALREVIMVACSEDCSDDKVKRAYALGVDCCVKKAKDLAEVIQVLQRVESYWFGHPPFEQRAA
jgi:CheY-like chemotaxis protein